MILVNLKGGLGNQLFQLNAAFFYAKRNEKILLYTDNLSKYNPPRKYSLDHFIYTNEVRIVKSNFRSIFFSINAFKLFSILLNRKKSNNLYKIFNIKILDGYFQENKYLSSDIIEIIYESLNKTINKSFLQNFPKLNSHIGIHIRGTDRSKNSNYHFNLNWIDTILDDENKTILCFTDDSLFAEKILMQLKCSIKYVSEYKLTELEEFYLITLLDKFIIVNSTFSIFARLLNNKKNTTFIINNTFGEKDILLHYLVSNQKNFVLI
jgi:hypothetical protein